MNSQDKGRRAERELCKIVTASTGEKCHRTPMSGAIPSISSADLYGEVFNKDHTLQFQAWEAKNRQAISFRKWWSETKDRAALSGRRPVLAIRLPNAEWVVCSWINDYLGAYGTIKHLEKEIEAMRASA